MASKIMAARTVKGEFFSTKQRKPVHRFVTRDFFSISYKNMDAYKGMFVLCTINGPCAWHQVIAGPFNKNLNAKLICDFGVTRLIFLCSFCGPKGKKNAYVSQSLCHMLHYIATLRITLFRYVAPLRKYLPGKYLPVELMFLIHRGCYQLFSQKLSL